jgi:hypothetical protein
MPELENVKPRPRLLIVSNDVVILKWQVQGCVTWN